MLSLELLQDRAGNFTASENHRLMAGWDNQEPSRDFAEFDALYPALSKIKEKGNPKPLVGEVEAVTGERFSGKAINAAWDVIQYEQPPTGLITYAEEKAMEELFEPDESLIFSTVHTRNGEERELTCMNRLAEATGLKFVQTGDNQAHIHANGVGCTPDGIVLDDIDLTKTGAEVKCKSPLVHAKNLLINNNDDLKENSFDHYVQIQTQMLVTGADHWYFANYNPCAKYEELKFKYIIVKRDNDFIEILQKRIDIAKKIKADFLEKFTLMIDHKEQKAA